MSTATQLDSKQGDDAQILGNEAPEELKPAPLYWTAEVNNAFPMPPVRDTDCGDLPCDQEEEEFEGLPVVLGQNSLSDEEDLVTLSSDGEFLDESDDEEAFESQEGPKIIFPFDPS